MDSESQQRFDDQLAKVGTPIFGLDARSQWERSVGGWGMSEIELRHRRDDKWLEVHTSTRDGGRPLAVNLALTRWMGVRFGFEDDYDFPIELRIDRSARPLSVDGVDVVFDVVGDAESWIASAVMVDRSVLIDARRVSFKDVGLVTASLDDYWNPWKEQ